jgi:hypothetical protein
MSVSVDRSGSLFHEVRAGFVRTNETHRRSNYLNGGPHRQRECVVLPCLGHFMCGLPDRPNAHLRALPMYSPCSPRLRSCSGRPVPSRCSSNGSMNLHKYLLPLLPKMVECARSKEIRARLEALFWGRLGGSCGCLMSDAERGSRAAIYALMAGGAFPASVRLARRARGWRSHDIEAWLEALNTK